MNRLSIVAIAACVLFGCKPQFDLDGFQGKAGVFSPDGKHLSFERQDGWNRHLGVIELKTGKITWVEDGPGIAGLASWSADGSLVYIYGNVTNTAYEAYVSKKGQCKDGYGIRIWKDGKKRDFTSGRRMDGTPVTTPDGKEMWWVSSKGLANHRLPMIQMWKAPISDSSQQQVALTNHIYGIDALVNQPQFSPDGKLVAWAMLDRLRDRWGIRLAKASDPNRNVPITPQRELAYEPRWSADGKYLVYSAWQEGDDGWQCVIQEVSSGVEKRLCRGFEPCLSPDGKTLVCTDVGREHLWVKEMTPSDYPHGSEVAGYEIPDTAMPFFATNFPSGATHAFMPLGKEFDFGNTDAFAVTLRFRLGADAPKKGGAELLSARYGRIGPSVKMQISDGNFLFVICDSCYQFAGMETAFAAKRGEHTLTLVRTADRSFISVDGSEPTQQVARHGHLMLDKPLTLELGKGLGKEDSLISCSFTRGWPKGMKRPMMRKEALQ